MNTAPFARGSATSKAAAQAVAPYLSPMRARVCNALIQAHPAGLTCDDIEVATNTSHQSASPRLRELEALGIVRETTVKRATRSGHEAFVWELTGNAPSRSALKIAASKSAPSRDAIAKTVKHLREYDADIGLDADVMEVAEWLERRLAL